MEDSVHILVYEKYSYSSLENQFAKPGEVSYIVDAKTQRIERETINDKR
jgi:hypothetical protein